MSISSGAGAGLRSRLGLCACLSLPLALGWSLPRGHGPSAEAFPLMVGLLGAGLTGLTGLGRVGRGALAWLALVLGALLLRGGALPLYNLMLLPVGVAVWIGFALGDAALREARVARAIGAGLAAGLAVNFVATLLQYLHLDASFAPWIAPRDGADRPYGNLRQANHLGMFFALSLAPLWWLAARGALSRVTATGWVAAASLAIALSGSRIAALSAGAAAVMALVWRRSLPSGLLAPFLAAPLLVLLFSAGMSLLSAFAGVAPVGVADRGLASVSMRLFHWRATLELIAAQPWTGVGWREYRLARFLLHPEDASVEVAEHAHNLFLHLAAEIGVPLTLLVVAPVAAWVWRCRPWRERDARVQAAWLALLLIFLYSQVEFPLWVMNFLFVAAVAAGVVLGAAQGKAWALPRLAGGALLVLMAVALVDYDRASAAGAPPTLLDWGATRQERAAAARRTLLFDMHVERLLLPELVLTDANPREVLERTGDLMHFGPDPGVLEVRLVAACLAGDLALLRDTAQAYRRGFPQAFAGFRRGLPAELAARCPLERTAPAGGAARKQGAAMHEP